MQFITIISALFTVFVVAVCCVGFFGWGHNNSLTNLNVNNQKLIADVFNINISPNMEIVSFERNNYGVDLYYCVIIKSDKGISEFKTLNKNIKDYTEKKLMIWKSSYVPISSDICCFYNENQIVVSVFSYSKNCNASIEELFQILYGKNQSEFL